MGESTTMRVIMRRAVPDPGEAAVSFGIASAARDVAISVGIVLGLLYPFPIIGRVISGPRWHWDPQHAALMTAGLKPQARTGLGSLLIGAWAGPGLLIGLAASAVVLGGLLLCFCDA
jgi:ABC-2 type transport system permease protein